jgi:glutamate racemase
MTLAHNNTPVSKAPHGGLTIGVFDSGVGGLTVLSPLMAQFSNARFVYLADNAYMPYGEQSPEVLLQRLSLLLPWLAQRCDVIALACNTAASLMIEQNRLAEWGVPVVDPIQPVCHQLSNLPSGNEATLVVLATPKTTHSGVYPKVLRELNPSLDVRSVSGQQLAGYFEHGHPNPTAYEALLDEVAREIRSHVSENSPSSLILGCTHYPHMRAALADRLPKSVTFVDPADAMVTQLAQVVGAMPFTSEASSQGALNKGHSVAFWVTGDGERFKTVAQQCSGLVVDAVQQWRPENQCVTIY